jgi:hypothetical protein
MDSLNTLNIKLCPMHRSIEKKGMAHQVTMYELEPHGGFNAEHNHRPLHRRLIFPFILPFKIKITTTLPYIFRIIAAAHLCLGRRPLPSALPRRHLIAPCVYLSSRDVRLSLNVKVLSSRLNQTACDLWSDNSAVPRDSTVPVALGASTC